MQSCLEEGAVVHLFKSHSLRPLCANRGDNKCLSMNTVVVFSDNKLCKCSSRVFSWFEYHFKLVAISSKLYIYLVLDLFLYEAGTAIKNNRVKAEVPFSILELTQYIILFSLTHCSGFCGLVQFTHTTEVVLRALLTRLPHGSVLQCWSLNHAAAL